MNHDRIPLLTKWKGQQQQSTHSPVKLLQDLVYSADSSSSCPASRLSSAPCSDPGADASTSATRAAGMLATTCTVFTHISLLSAVVQYRYFPTALVFCCLRFCGGANGGPSSAKPKATARVRRPKGGGPSALGLLERSSKMKSIGGGSCSRAVWSEWPPQSFSAAATRWAIS
jgi:hypothetical protein